MTDLVMQLLMEAVQAHRADMEIMEILVGLEIRAADIVSIILKAVIWVTFLMICLEMSFTEKDHPGVILIGVLEEKHSGKRDQISKVKLRLDLTRLPLDVKKWFSCRERMEVYSR